MQDLLSGLSNESAYQRFMAHKSSYPHAEMQELVDANSAQNVGMVAGDPETGALVAMARYDMDPATLLGDIAFAVRDDWQRRGIGSCLMRKK